ncbi:hypothetical protein B0T10DRAFT_107202 [Thelonectria olida]|uniref:Uncharacterized protein n=1 Tax=Thelonectria olida TaxID=1576542 RepID=A0A9P8WGE2_9HYPO|nr:hypothetical protein B0T10DRAFT_107202 [Thelonectria olida]
MKQTSIAILQHRLSRLCLLLRLPLSKPILSSVVSHRAEQTRRACNEPEATIPTPSGYSKSSDLATQLEGSN